MAQVSKYRYLLNQYPETVQKEQFRIICHISKRTARYLLQSGLVPCVQSGKKTRNYTIKMKDIVRYADLNPVVGSEQGGIRPVLVIQNDVGNHFSPTVVAAAITSRKAKNSLPTHILLENVPGLAPTSLLLLEQLRTIDRKRLRGYIGRISKEKMLEVDAALAISIGIGYPNERRTHNV